MAEEFQGRGACGGSWRNSFGNLLGSSPCSLPTNDIGSFGLHNPARSSDDCSAGSACVGGSSTEVYKPQPQTTANGSVSVYSTLQTTGITISSSSTAPHDWNRDLPHDEGRSDEYYSDILQEAADLDSGMDYLKQTKVHFPRIHKDWNSRNVSQDSFPTSLKRDVQNLPLEHHQPLNSHASSSERGETCQGLSFGFPLNSASYSYTSSLLQTLFDTNFDQPKQSILHDQAINYLYPENSNEFLPSLPKDTPMVNPSFTKQQSTNHLPSFINSAPLLNTTDADLSNVSGSSLSQLLSSSLNIKKPNLPRLNTKHQNETAGGLSSLAKKFSNESSVKRPRIETSPLPTFRVRKEKLGDRITALQQLVSPFGKTDTASVLHEAIEYIKFLHDQVSVLSTPYLKTGFSPLLQRPQAADKSKAEEGLIHDLKSRGLCLIPISSTFPVAADPTSDFRNPTFGGSYE